MAFTLEELTNIMKGTPITDPATFIEKIDASIKFYADRLKTGTDNINTYPNYVTYAPTADQVNEFCNRALDTMMMSTRMRCGVCSDPGIEVADINSTDAAINAAVQSRICAYCAKM